MESIVKDPDAILDYGFDWSEWLGTDTITASSWAVPAGLTEVADGNSTTTTVVWLSGGTAGASYTCTNTITTSEGRTDERSLVVMVRER